MNAPPLIELLKKELCLSYGCTEPASVGLAVSRTCRYLSEPIERVSVLIGSNIYKNAYCVKIPNTGKCGIDLAAALGVILSDRENTLEIFSRASVELAHRAEKMISDGMIKINTVTDSGFYIEVQAYGRSEHVITWTCDRHDNMVKAVKNGETLYKKSGDAQREKEDSDDSYDITELSVEEIVSFCEQIGLKEISFISEAIEVNWDASLAGQDTRYGLGVGWSIRQLIGKGVLNNDLNNFVRMVTGSAADCRMGGGSIPVMTLLGSGNQGIQAILPVAAAAEYLRVSEEKKLRAVVMSTLITIYIKRHVGRLSPICGATLAGAAASGAIAWLMGNTLEQIEGAINNVLGNLAGMICDGAKDGCALKLACCAGEAVIAAKLAMNGSIIEKTDGIVGATVADTVKNIARLSREGMAMTDGNIISILLNKTLPEGKPKMA